MRENGGCTSKEIKFLMKQQLGKAVTESKFYDALNRLESKRKIFSLSVIFSEDREMVKGIKRKEGEEAILYARIGDYPEWQFKGILQKTLAYEHPIAISPMFWSIPPACTIGNGYKLKNEYSGLLSAAIEKFREELAYIVTSDENRAIKNKHILAKLVWASHKHSLSNLSEFLQRHKQEDPSLNTMFAELFSCQNLGHLLEYLRKPNNILDAGIKSFVRDFYPAIYRILPEYEWFLLDRAILHLDFSEYSELGGDMINIVKEILDINDGENNSYEPLSSTTLQTLIDEISKIRFTLIVTVGEKEIDHLHWDWVLDNFNHWMESLKNGHLDWNEELFIGGLRELKVFIKVLRECEGLKHSGVGAFDAEKPILRYFKNIGLNVDFSPKPKAWEMLAYSGIGYDRKLIEKKADEDTKQHLGTKSDRYDLFGRQGFDLFFLYEHHPKGRDITFYEGIYQAIEQRKKLRQVKSIN